MTRRTVIAGAAATGAVGVAEAQTEGGALTARAYMQGFPPTGDAARVDASNWHLYPQAKWAVRHMRELFASRDAAPVGRRPAELQTALQPLDELRVRGEQGDMSWSDFLSATHTDAAIVLHNGRIVFERYFDGMAQSDQHLLFSCTKSYCGLIAEILASRGQLDFSRTIESYLPEMANSAFAGAAVRQVADMTDGVHFSEDYTDPSADIYPHAYQMGLSPHDPSNPPRGAYASAQTLTRRDHPPGHAFAYRSVATDVLGWIIQRVANKSLSQLYAEEIYTHTSARRAQRISPSTRRTWRSPAWVSTSRCVISPGLAKRCAGAAVWARAKRFQLRLLHQSSLAAIAKPLRAPTSRRVRAGPTRVSSGARTIGLARSGCSAYAVSVC